MELYGNINCEKEEKKNESKIHIIISYSVVVLAKLSEITQP